MIKETKEAEEDPIVFKCLDGNSAVAHVSYRINDTAVCRVFVLPFFSGILSHFMPLDYISHHSFVSHG